MKKELTVKEAGRLGGLTKFKRYGTKGMSDMALKGTEKRWPNRKTKK